MNPSPVRSKECLPPKKRESRQGSSDQPTQEDDFKPPAPLRSRRHHYSTTEGHRESGILQPPPLPMLPPLPLPLPWPVSYAPSMHHSYMPVQVGERRGMVSSSWRDTMCRHGMDRGPDHPISHHSRWLCSDISPLNLQPSTPVPTFKSVYAGKSREMWPYSHNRREYSLSFFSPPPFPQPTIYPHDTLPEARLSYQGRQPNSVDVPDGRSGSSRKVPSCNDYRNDRMTRLDGSYANGRRRQDTAEQSTGKGLLPQDNISAHSSPWDRDPRGTPKVSMLPSSGAKAGKTIASQDHGIASQAGAQIYYALGSLCSSAQQTPQAHPQLSLSKPRSCPLRNFQPSPHNQPNSHGAETEWDASAGFYCPAVTVLTGPDSPPSTVLPHFAKGSLIELAGGHLKRVEELKIEDFLRSADTLPEFNLSTCTILLISPGPTHGFNYLQVLLTDRNTQELLTVLAEFPFFVWDHGWSSCSPQRSAQLYGLQCRQLSTGDVCLALTPTPTLLHSTTILAHSSSQVQHSLSRSEAGTFTCTNTAERMPPLPEAQTTIPQKERPRTRKRHWSAPELQSGSKTSSHLPQGSKHEKVSEVYGNIQSQEEEEWRNQMEKFAAD